MSNKYFVLSFSYPLSLLLFIFTTFLTELLSDNSNAEENAVCRRLKEHKSI